MWFIIFVSIWFLIWTVFMILLFAGKFDRHLPKFRAIVLFAGKLEEKLDRHLPKFRRLLRIR